MWLPRRCTVCQVPAAVHRVSGSWQKQPTDDRSERRCILAVVMSAFAPEAGLTRSMAALRNTWNRPKSGAWLWAKSLLASVRLLLQRTLIWRALSHARRRLRCRGCVPPRVRRRRMSCQTQTGPSLVCPPPPVAAFHLFICFVLVYFCCWHRTAERSKEQKWWRNNGAQIWRAALKGLYCKKVNVFAAERASLFFVHFRRNYGERGEDTVLMLQAAFLTLSKRALSLVWSQICSSV